MSPNEGFPVMQGAVRNFGYRGNQLELAGNFPLDNEASLRLECLGRRSVYVRALVSKSLHWNFESWNGSCKLSPNVSGAGPGPKVVFRFRDERSMMSSA